MLGAYIIKDYTTRDGEKKSKWMLVGSAFKNNDGSLNVLLDALPLDGKIHIRKIEPKQEGARR